MEGPQPGGTTLPIMVSPVPGKYAFKMGRQRGILAEQLQGMVFPNMHFFFKPSTKCQSMFTVANIGLGSAIAFSLSQIEWNSDCVHGNVDY